ncbi:MAG: DMT family transporter [Halomonadaceae bacterium]|nr:DMT family transporter [Halomonadaceae bacterium]
MLAFAANSLLTRLALEETSIDPATFTSVRLIAGALMLALIIGLSGKRPGTSTQGMLSAALLFIYAVAFSFAYRGMETGAGALVLFASAQLLMLGFGYARGERTHLLGIALALGGLIVFLAPSDTTPPLNYSHLMLVAGIAWGGFSLVGRADGSPVLGTANSFILAAPLALLLLWWQRDALVFDAVGLMYAALAGSVTSALGYVVWYWVRVRMATISAGTVQLSVPVLSAMLGLLILDEALSARSAVAASIVLLGIALTTRATRVRAPLARHAQRLRRGRS